jgi:uncharacterized protein
MARRTRLYFATDVHGSEKCFRKFLNAAAVYRADVMVLGGDVAGKAIQAITRAPGGRYTFTFRGVRYDLEDGGELEAAEQLIRDHGYYPYREDPGELQALEDTEALEGVFEELIAQRLTRWLDLADERLRPRGVPLYLMLGNDDPEVLRPLLDGAPWGEQSEGRVVHIDDDHEMISWGYSNPTPWQTYREQSEDDLQARYAALVEQLGDPERAVVNFHPPPYDSGLDEAPVLDATLQVQSSAGQARMAPVGSRAVRDVLERVQPLLGLHGHIHESTGFRRYGRALAINPGSDYGTGTLNGVLVTLAKDKVQAHQFVRG